MKISLKKFSFSILILCCLFTKIQMQTVNQTKQPVTHQTLNVCRCWQAKVDETIEKQDACQSLNEAEDESVLIGIDCLLKMEGVKNPAEFGGAMSIQVSQTFAQNTADEAALYYISYLFYQRFDHAKAVALVDEKGQLYSEKAIKKAYKHYKGWFKKIKKLGLIKAREQNLNPLANSRIRWY